MRSTTLTARGESLAAFDGRCIPAGCVAPRSNTPGILGRRALPSGRIARLGATPDFHHRLLNGFIPLVALQLSAIKIGDHLALTFTKVLDQIQLGVVDDDIEIQAPATRAFWEERSTKETLAIVDELVQFIKAIDHQLEPKYNKHFIGLARNGKPDNFVGFQRESNGSGLGWHSRRVTTQQRCSRRPV